MKVLVTVGLERKPYDRLLRAVDEAAEKGWIPDDTLVQSGHNRYTLHHCRSVPFLSFDEFQSAVRSADLVIAHGGVGSVLLALEEGKIPLVLPRRADLGEHVDNHQIEFVKKMEHQGRVMAAYDVSRFKWVLESGDWMKHSMDMACREPEIAVKLRKILESYEKREIYNK